ncbi:MULTISPECIES: Uma2 family endonuclease [Aerosakkonema]|uniref:Uma2 family endonuclease n=1 Tax=Aerosakkonema TaxID=1246629 RepID=UPI0035B9CDD6
MALTVKHLEQLQIILKENHLDYQLELRDGKIIVMGPSDIVSSEVGAIFCRLLGNWVYPRRLGRVFESSGGFILPNSDLTAPDVSFVSAERLRQSPRYFGRIVPDLVVEIKSQSDRIRPLREKIQLFLNEGAKVGILIDPDRLTVTVYRLNNQPVVLNDGDILTLPDLFPDWELLISEIWPTVFE